MNELVEIFKTKEFVSWFKKQSEKRKIIIEARLDRISYFGHLGTVNRFDSIVELKWKSGLRIYTYQLDNQNLIVLLGGTKNGQKKDIKKAKTILETILSQT